MSTLGWSVSEKDTEWKLASDVTWRGEKLMLRTATVRGWQPHPGVVSRPCLATLLRVLMTAMLVPERNKEYVQVLEVNKLQNHQTKKVFSSLKRKSLQFSTQLVPQVHCMSLLGRHLEWLLSSAGQSMKICVNRCGLISKTQWPRDTERGSVCS